MNHEGKTVELGGENSFTSKCSEKSQPLDFISRAKRLLLCTNITAATIIKTGQIYMNCSIYPRNVIKKIFYDLNLL